MMDAYTHLDMSAQFPITALEQWMDKAAIDRALVVETWSQDNRSCLDQIIASPSPRFRVALCFRATEERFSPTIFEQEAVGGIRIRTTDLQTFRSFAGALESSKKWLIPHSEAGIGELTSELIDLIGDYPELRILLPHMGWPRRNQQDDEVWHKSVSKLSSLPNVVAGISAISHFSRMPFPHEDIKPFAIRLRELFGSESLFAGSDYPLFETGRYVDYIKLATEWIGPRAEEPGRFESILFENPAS
jgi:predicted TIM-barrel fold metal-dependent hydrolase